MSVGIVGVALAVPALGQVTPHPRLPQCRAGDPDLLLPDLVPDPPADARNIVIAGRRELQFTTGVANVGDGPLIIEGRTISTPAGLVTQGYQIIWRRDGSQCARATGRFEFHPTHQHWHFENFVGYELRRDDPVRGPLAATGTKASYCLLDLAVARGFHPARNPRQVTNMDCDSQEGIQGISVGWKDVYERFLPGQSIDLDRSPEPVPPGSYYLVNVVDPDGLLWEKDRSNNLSYVVTTVSLRAPTPAPAGVATPTPQPTPRAHRPRLQPGRIRPTRPPRPVVELPTPTPRPAATPTPDRSRPTAPVRGQTPPAATPTMAAGGGTVPAACANACRADISQLRLTWYDQLGLNFSGLIGPRNCGWLDVSSGRAGGLYLYNWMTDARLTNGPKDIGKRHVASFVLDGSGRGVTSAGGRLQFTRTTNGVAMTYTAGDPPIGRQSDGIWFPVVFDACIVVGDQAVRGRMVCQPKPTGLLCHQG